MSPAGGVIVRPAPPPGAARWIKSLRLVRHREGGYYRETYRSPESIPGRVLPRRFAGSRSVSTAIYYLLSGDDFSAFHRLRSDEVWHWYAGGTLLLHVIEGSGRLRTVKLGRNPGLGERFQAVVPAGSWFAARPARRRSYSLLGCTVAPGFNFADFELGDREKLLELFPQHARLIRELTCPRGRPGTGTEPSSAETVDRRRRRYNPEHETLC